MVKINSGQNRNTVLILCGFIFGLILRELNTVYVEYGKLLGGAQTIVFAGLMFAWCLLVHYRLLHPKIRNYLIALSVFIIFWIILRGVKYYMFPPGTNAVRYLWYAYYIPMMYYPTCAIAAVAYIGKYEDWKLPGYMKLVFLIPALISAIVLTNDFHQLVFKFPEGAGIWSDARYEYGPLYILPFSYFLLCVTGVFGILIKRCRIPQKQRLSSKLLLLPPFLGICYNLAYITGHAGFFSDLIIAMSFLTVLTFELAIRLGYIRSNSNYRELFQLTSIDAQIFDEKRRLRYISGNSVEYDSETVEKAIRDGSVVQGNLRYAAEAIGGGYIVWKEDMTELFFLKRQLEAANESLEDRNMVQRKRNETRIRRKKLEEQRRLYYEMQSRTEEKLNEMNRLLAEFEKAAPEEEMQYLPVLGILTVYLKRRNNLLFLAQGQEWIPGAELENCMTEMAGMLEAFGMTCAVYVRTIVLMGFEQMVSLYDAFEKVIEETVIMRPAYFVTITGEGDSGVLRIRVSGIEKIPESIAAVFAVSAQEDDDFLIEIKIGREEADDTVS